jgi:hypothetical protein
MGLDDRFDTDSGTITGTDTAVTQNPDPSLYIASLSNATDDTYRVSISHHPVEANT